MRKIAFLSIGVLVFMVSCLAFSTAPAPEVPAPAFTLESESTPVVEPTELVDTPVPALPLKKAILITSSKASGCAVTSDGETRCWSMFAPPAVVEALPPLAGLECRAERCIGFTQSGELYEWYIGSPAKLLEGIHGVIDIAIGDNFACAITVETVQCWGSVPGRDRTGNTDRSITEEPLFLGKAWTLADAAATYACFLGAYEDDDMCIGFFPNMGTNRYAYGFNPRFGDVKDLRFSETVYCVVRATGQVLCSDNKKHDTGNDPFPKDFFSNAVDFDVSDPLSCRINPDYSVECIKDDTVTAIQDLKADAVSIKTSGLEATILLSDGSVAILDSHPKYKITYLAGFGSP